MHAQEIFQGALRKLGELEQSRDDDFESRKLGFRAMRELDVALLETAALGDLIDDRRQRQGSAAPRPHRSAICSSV